MTNKQKVKELVPKAKCLPVGRKGYAILNGPPKVAAVMSGVFTDPRQCWKSAAKRLGLK